jgi:hypothetical protein
MKLAVNNYDIALLRNGSNLVTAASPKTPGKLTVGIINMTEPPVKFPGRCRGMWSHYHYLLTGMVEM